MRTQIVSFHCVLRNQLGAFISETFNRDVITEVPVGTAELRALAEGLKGLRKGEKRRICLSAKEAYGFYDPDLVIECTRKDLTNGQKVAVGDQVAGLDVHGRQRQFRVVLAEEKRVTLDANHPLAGQDLVFEIEATEARDATPQELQEVLQEVRPEGTLLH